MGKYGIATRAQSVNPTGFARAHDEVWENGIKRELAIDEALLDKRLMAAGTAGPIVVAESEIIVSESLNEDPTE